MAIPKFNKTDSIGKFLKIIYFLSVHIVFCIRGSIWRTYGEKKIFFCLGWDWRRPPGRTGHHSWADGLYSAASGSYRGGFATLQPDNKIKVSEL